jgi:hypothetical protein
MALFFIEHKFESRAKSKCGQRTETDPDRNHNGRVKRARNQKAAEGNSTVTTANSNHQIQISFVVSRRSLALAPQPPGGALALQPPGGRSLLNHREARSLLHWGVALVA